MPHIKDFMRNISHNFSGIFLLRFFHATGCLYYLVMASDHFLPKIF